MATVFSDFTAVIEYFYHDQEELKLSLVAHSEQVCTKALEILDSAGCPEFGINRQRIITGAMLHDIGICRCHAPGILCHGTHHYITHGLLGGEMLREYGQQHGVDLEFAARICERHTGSGLTAAEIIRQELPLPHRNFLPETLEEKLICLADKFFSKSGSRQEKSMKKVRSSMAKFGEDSLARFEALCLTFGISC